MNKTISPLAAQVAALKETYAALNRNDIEAAVHVFDAQIAWVEPSDWPGGGTIHGREAVKVHLSLARSTWAEGNCEPERYITVGDKIIVVISVRVRLKNETEWREGRHAAVYTFRNDRAIEMRIIDDTQQALEWAGVAASVAN